MRSFIFSSPTLRISSTEEDVYTYVNWIIMKEEGRSRPHRDTDSNSKMDTRPKVKKDGRDLSLIKEIKQKL